MNGRPKVTAVRTFKKTVEMEISWPVIRMAIEAYLMRNFAEFRGTHITITYLHDGEQLTVNAVGIKESHPRV